MRYRLFALLVCFGVNLFGSNPFTIDANQRDFQAQQKNTGKKFLQTESIQLPSNARELKSVTLKYQNIDGSIDTRELLIDKTIDWHYPIRITQENAIANISRRYFSLNDFEFFMEGATFSINSGKHKIIRHFLLPSPTTIVIDFSRDRGAGYTGSLGTGEHIFTDVSVDTKETFYRVSITLDGTYKYSLKSKNNTHVISVQ